MVLATVFAVHVKAAENYSAYLYGRVTDARQVVNKMVIDFGDDKTVSGIDVTFTCDNTIIDEETAKFVSIKDKINYQLYKGTTDSLIVWFHGNGEGDYLSSGNNVAQMLANRGTVAWTTEEVFGNAYVMSFQAPDTWYYAQNDGLFAIV